MKAVWILCGTVLFLLVLGSIPFSVRFRLQKTAREGSEKGGAQTAKERAKE